MLGQRVVVQSASSRSPRHGTLQRYRVMAFTTAILLIVLVFVGLPLQFAFHHAGVADTVGTLHGILYLIYLGTAFQLTRQLAISKAKMLLVLLAGTVPFCAFVAERAMTRRYVELAGTPAMASAARAVPWRQRWCSRRAMLLHLEVIVLAPGCALAGWWQATRALAGNTLSWFYSVEWPVFAVLALVGWWYLIHEDPDAYAARKAAPHELRPVGVGPVARLTVEAATGRFATALAILVGLEFALGVTTLVLVPFSRPSGFTPPTHVALYQLHAALGIPLAVGAVLLVARVRAAERIARLSGIVGALGVALAGAGGLLTASHPLRLAGMGIMLLGSAVAGFGYLFPTLEKASARDA